MCNTLAEIFSLTWSGLGQPKNLDLNQVKRAVHEAATLYWTDLKQSDRNQVISVTQPLYFVPDQYVYPLTNLLPNMALPDWVEINYGTSNFDWTPVTTANRDSLLDFRNRGEIACAFYGLYQNVFVSDTIEWSYITPYLAGRAFRIWYDPSVSITTGESGQTGFPPEFNYLIAYEAQLDLIGICKDLVIKEAKQNQADIQMMQFELRNWNEKYAMIQSKRDALKEKWIYYKKRSRTLPGRAKRPIYNKYL